MDGSGGGEIIAKMLQAAKRIVDAIVDKAAPRISETHHKVSHGIQDHLGRVGHEDEQLAPELDRIGSAARMDRDTAAEYPESGAGAQRPVYGPDPNRFEIFSEEAQELYEQV
ncbi:hypothetical protein AB0B25_31790, partial [Nocardia sp. NPDC049190]|uniref:hypothetical protein n=1 Tax=Nocardia sp. NPDC049190 TaxID=3155650 RepID=UPI00340A6A46